jgi:hypothetical protein
MKQVDRPKDEWVAQERTDIRIISDEDWHAAQARWREIDGVFPSKRQQEGLRRQAQSYVDSHHPHTALRRTQVRLACGGAIAPREREGEWLLRLPRTHRAAPATTRC